MNNIVNIQSQVALVAEVIPPQFQTDRVPVNAIFEATRDQLIPQADCQAMDERLKAARMATKTEALTTALKIMNMFPSSGKDDVFLEQLSSVMADDLLKVPLCLHKQVFDIMTKSDRFYPTRASLEDTIREVLAPRNNARHIATRHLGRHRILDKHHPETAPKADLRQKLEGMPQSSSLAATVAKALSTLPGSDPEASAGLQARFSA